MSLAAPGVRGEGLDTIVKFDNAAENRRSNGRTLTCIFHDHGDGDLRLFDISPVRFRIGCSGRVSGKPGMGVVGRRFGRSCLAGDLQWQPFEPISRRAPRAIGHIPQAFLQHRQLLGGQRQLSIFGDGPGLFRGPATGTDAIDQLWLDAGTIIGHSGQDRRDLQRRHLDKALANGHIDRVAGRPTFADD